ncbi:hypothetical protein SLS60_000093 [Paraconiothyrium brasiliense]|uniref:VIT domain-containing protein n=1 Tax=Paraconiothyrium brasiliense TaxID=300254 RepID=A0ABR3S5F8_9PLEO
MSYHICGCYYFHPTARERYYLPQVKLDTHTTILSTASRTVLKQKFINPSKEELEEVRYAFPLFDGVSVVDFFCKVGDRTLHGLVKEKAEARQTYEEAKERGEKAALLEQIPDAADVFTTSVSNIPKNSTVEVSITYIQELKHDAEVDGVRLIVPTSVSPRYGSYPGQLMSQTSIDDTKGISLTIDVRMADGIPIKKVLSPSHPIEVSMGSLSTSTADEDPLLSKASATLVLRTAQLEKDFVLQVVAKDVGVPQAILETHPTLPNQRALMTTLVPKFNVKSQKPEIIFIADRSGSMQGNITTLISALKVFLKSIPIGCMHVSEFRSNFGGTETLRAVKACFEARLKEMPTELMLLTDGDIWSQQQLFEYIHDQTKTEDVRVFPIGIGGGVSSALIEGIARAGHGFAQMVANNEKLDSKIVRMLKGALTPHIKDYRLEVRYEDDSVDSVTDSLRIHLNLDDQRSDQTTFSPDKLMAKPISLYDTNAKEEHPKSDEGTDIFAGLPKLDRPKILQTPHEMPPLFPFNRTCVYLLLSPSVANAKPKTVVLKGTSPQGPLELEIPVEVRTAPDQMIHQLAARKATQELEEGRGWITEAITDGEKPGETIPISKRYPAKTALLQRREAVRLGVEFQVGGKYCSFVAVEANEAEIAQKRKQTINGSLKPFSDENTDDWVQFFDTNDVAYYGSSGTQSTSHTNSGPKYGTAQLMDAMLHYNTHMVASPGYDAEFSAEPLMHSYVQGPILSQAMQQQFQGFSYNRPVVLDCSVDDVSLIRRDSASTGKKRKTDISTGDVAGAEELQLEEMEDIDYSDEDLGYALFDGSSVESTEALKKQREDSSSGMARVDLLHTEDPSARRLSYDSAMADSEEDNAVGASRFLKADDTSSENDDAINEDASGDDEDDEAAVSADEGTFLESIITQQLFDGSWKCIKPSLQKEMGIESGDYRKQIDGLVLSEYSLDRGKAEVALSTALIVLYLESKLADEEETWELIVEKAKTWLGNNVDGGMMEAAFATATELLKA